MKPSHLLLATVITLELYAALATDVFEHVLFAAGFTLALMLGQCRKAVRDSRRELLFRITDGRPVEVRYTNNIHHVGVAAYISGTDTILVTRLWKELDENHRWAVLAHELGHARDRTGNGLFVAAVALWWGLPIGMTAALLSGHSFNAAMTVTVCMLPLLRLLRCAIERGCEHEADQYAKQLGYGRYLAAVLHHHQAACRPAPTLIARLLASHPPLPSRMRRILS